MQVARLEERVDPKLHDFTLLLRGMLQVRARLFCCSVGSLALGVEGVEGVFRELRLS